jgi:lactate permease
MENYNILITLIPILSIFSFLIVLRIKPLSALFLSMVITALSSKFLWEMKSLYVFASLLEAVIIVISICWIILGAILLYKTLEATKKLDKIKSTLKTISSDERVQIILIGFFFVTFLEGIAGFGTPAVICAPLLITQGIPKKAAVVLPLMADATAISFGAAGTPLFIGINKGLDHIHGTSQVSQYLADEGLTFFEFLNEIARVTVSVDFFIATFVPLFMVLVYAKFFSYKKNFSYGLEVWKFALGAGLFYSLVTNFSARFLSFEFPSILAGFLGLIIFSIIAYKRKKVKKKKILFRDMISAWAPHVSVIILLLITRLVAPLKSFLQGNSFHFNHLLGSEISVSLNLLYSPGSVFLVVAAVLLYLDKKVNLKQPLFLTLKTMGRIFVLLLFSLGLVRIFINSSYNFSNLPSQPEFLAIYLSSTFGKFYAFFAPFIGALGSFLSGSTTFSNMMFSDLQFKSAMGTMYDPKSLIAVSMLGANAGNMIALSNVISVSGVAGVAGKENEIIRFNFIPMFIYAFLAGLIIFGSFNF